MCAICVNFYEHGYGNTDFFIFLSVFLTSASLSTGLSVFTILFGCGYAILRCTFLHRRFDRPQITIRHRFWMVALAGVTGGVPAQSRGVLGVG